MDPRAAIAGRPAPAPAPAPNASLPAPPPGLGGWQGGLFDKDSWTEAQVGCPGRERCCCHVAGGRGPLLARGSWAEALVSPCHGEMLGQLVGG